MNKQIILNQCDKIKDVVKDATQNEEEARSNAEKFKEIKESNTELLSILNTAKDIYWELERTLRIIEIDKEYDNTSDELENLKIRVKDLISDLVSKVEDLENYESVKETVEFYRESIKDANEFIDGDSVKKVEETNRENNSTGNIDFSFDKDEEMDAPFSFDDDIFNASNEEKVSDNNKEIEDSSNDEDSSNVNSELNTFDFSSMYGFDSKEDEHADKQKVVSVTDFSDSVSHDDDKEVVKDTDENKEDSSSDSKTSDDTSLDELNDLFNYLNSDNSFSE